MSNYINNVVCSLFLLTTFLFGKETTQYKIKMEAVAEYFARQTSSIVVAKPKVLNELKNSFGSIVLSKENVKITEKTKNWEKIFRTHMAIYGFELHQIGNIIVIQKVEDSFNPKKVVWSNYKLVFHSLNEGAHKLSDEVIIIKSTDKGFINTLHKEYSTK